jgi:hypothetical protein
VVGRRHAATAFRPSAPAGRSSTPSRAQSILLLIGVVAIAAGLAIASYVVKPSRARAFNLFYGSIYINDNTSPVAVDLASGKPTVRLRNAFTSVSAKTTGELNVVALGGANTLMVNPDTGEFNMVDSTGFVVKATGGGVQLPKSTGVTRTSAVPTGDSAYLVQSSDSGTSIFLVNEATVSSAIGTNARAKARAYGAIKAPVAGGGAAASANGDLWLLTGTGTGTGADSAHAITQLSVPAASNAGVNLTTQSHGVVSGIAAVESATRNTDGTGGDVPAVASAKQVQVFSGGAVANLPVSVDGTVTSILPASNAQGELAFLYHTTSGWSRVSAPTAGAGKVQVTKLTTIDPSARLITPAASDGHLYTMDAGNGDLWQIDGSGPAHSIAGAGKYPVLKGETLDLTQSEVVARGGRVIFNGRANYEAEVVFSDGSQAPRTIDKHSAVQVDPTGATTLADLHAGPTKPGKPTPTKPTTRTPPPTQAINNKIDCRTRTLKPHIPTLQAGDRGARSISLTWIYPLLETNDCAPSTYVVSIKVRTPGAPSAGGSVTVHGQNGVTLTGLFPATQYQLAVTAYLHSESTTSPSILVTTGPEGPAAPTDVRAVPTASGDWTVSWNSCGGIKQGCVPSAEWNIIPKFCDDRGLSNVPTQLSVTGDPTVHSFTRTYPGGDALLGRGLCFAVQGVSPQGTNGTLSAYTPTAYSWSSPIAGTLRLKASQPANTALGGSGSTSVNLDLGSNPVRDVGGLGATITFTLNGPGGARTKTVVFDGKSDQLATTFPGIQAGAKYTAQATVHPPNHASASASTPTVTVTTRANWPTLSTAASCPNEGGPIVLSCTLTVRINGVSSAAAAGERFSLADVSGVVCGSSGFQLSKTDFDPARAIITQNVDLLAYNGTCTVTLALREGDNARDPAVFGGTTSPRFSTTVNLGRASTLDAGSGDFTAEWSRHNGSSALVKYTGPKTDGQVGQLTQQWSEQLSAPDGTACGSATAQPSHSGMYIEVNPASCVNDFGDQNGWRVTVSYYDRNTNNQHTQGYTLNSTPPGYIPCTVSAGNFAAAWASDPTVNLTFNPSGAQIDGCSDWQYSVRNATTTECGSDVGNPRSFGIAVQTTRDECTPGLGWSVQISYRDPSGQRHTLGQLTPILVTGTPPAPPVTSPPISPSPPPPTGS